MPSTFQPPLLVEPSAEVTLVSLDHVGAVRGWHIDRVVDWSVEQWTFDLSTHSRERNERRVWIRCLEDPEAAREAGLGEVIESVIGSPMMAQIRSASLETRWRVSGRTIARLRNSGDLEGVRIGSIWWITRSSLRSFLTRRLVR